MARTVLRWLLGAALVLAGVAHLSAWREEFRAQVPSWFPVDDDTVVLVSGVVEIVLGVALVVVVRRRVLIGLVTGAFFVVILPGNIAQFVEGTDAFGLDSYAERLARLFFQPVLVWWALWATGATDWLRRRSGGRGDGTGTA
jgi:uncharacterized membrane protein